MSLRIQLTAATLGTATLITATLITAIATFQLQKAEADNPQATATQPTPASAEKDSVYLDLAIPQPSTQAAAQKVRDALEKPITVEFKQTPLKDAVNHIAKLCGINATLNIKALNEEGIANDEPITLTRNQPAPATAVLKTVLEPLNLTVIIENDTLLVTTEIDAEEKLDLRLYDISSLVKTNVSSRSIIRFVQQETSGPWMDLDGTGGTISRFEHLLVISSTEQTHAETKLLLNDLERIITGDETTGVAALRTPPHDRKVLNALSQQVSGEFQQTPLREVAAYLANLTRIDILIDEVALAEEEKTSTEPITLQVEQISLKSALKRLLEPHDLTYVIDDCVLRITTAIVGEETQCTFAFNIRDFHEAGYDSEILIKSLNTATSGPWMEVDGTGGIVHDVFPGFLIIRQTSKVLDECILHLEELRSTLKQSSSDGQLPKSTVDPGTTGLILKQYPITNLPIEDVRNALPKFVAIDTWKSAGGRGELAVVQSKLIVRQTREVHHDIEEFLQEIGEILGIGSIGTGVQGTSSKLPGTGFFKLK